MNDNRKSLSQGRGMGVGYVTLIMLFAVICLTVLASLSYQAARANDKLNDKSIYYTSSYYLADGIANEVLCALDEAAYEAHGTGFFSDSFEVICEEKLAEQNDRVYTVTPVLKRVQEGFLASYACPVTDNTEISVKILFFDTPRDDGRYRIEEWKTVAASGEDSEETLGVWDGSALG